MPEIVDPYRLIRLESTLPLRYPDLDFRPVPRLHTQGEPLLVTDPVYLADVYNARDEAAAYVRQRGIIVRGFGGDTSGPLWWQIPYLVLPISLHYYLSDEDDLDELWDVQILAQEVGCDSGSFVFLPLASDLPPALSVKVEKVLARSNGALVCQPAGSWSVFYEQWQDWRGQPSDLYRNIVARWEPSPALQPPLPL